MPSEDSNIKELSIQLPGEARPMSKSERKCRKQQAAVLRQQAEKLTKCGSDVTITVKNISSD